MAASPEAGSKVRRAVALMSVMMLLQGYLPAP
jgi:hypothetical protein